MARPSPIAEIAALREVCRKLGLGEVAPTVLKAAHHTSLLLSPLMIVARVQSSEPREVTLKRATQELAVVRHLARGGAPVLAPLDGELAGPHVEGPSIATLWPFVEQMRAADDTDALRGAALLASVHRHLLDYAGALPPYTQALDRCWGVIADNEACAALAADDREVLKTQYRRLRHDVEAMAGAQVPLHGDVHLGNLLVGRERPVWMDFEDACQGPREIDIGGLPPEAWTYFHDADARLIERCAELKSVCVAIWCWPMCHAARKSERPRSIICSGCGTWLTDGSDVPFRACLFSLAGPGCRERTS